MENNILIWPKPETENKVSVIVCLNLTCLNIICRPSKNYLSNLSTFCYRIFLVVEITVHNYETKLQTNSIKATYFITKYMIQIIYCKTNMQNITNI